MGQGKTYYPMMSGAAWHKLRGQFQNAMPATVSRSYLASALGITERSAANLLGPMRAFGLIDNDGTPTDRAGHWCVADRYQAVCNAILEDVYPAELRSTIPDPGEHRDATIAWFKQNGGVGQAGASKMAATYELVTESGSGLEPVAKAPAGEAATAIVPEPPSIEIQPPSPTAGQMLEVEFARDAHSQTQEDAPTLHRDVHVHIAADASPEQIDHIFASMARHLYRRH